MHLCIMYFYVCMYFCMYVCRLVCIYVFMYVRMYLCMYFCMYVCIYVFMYVLCMFACMYVCVCMYVCLCVCTYVCINLTFVFPCIVSVITIDNQQDATILFYLFLISSTCFWKYFRPSGAYHCNYRSWYCQLHPICNASQQQHR